MYYRSAPTLHVQHVNIIKPEEIHKKELKESVQMKDHDNIFQRRLTNQYMTDGKNDPNSLRRKNVEQ